MGKFSEWQIGYIFIWFFSEKENFDISQFAWNVSVCFLEKQENYFKISSAENFTWHAKR